MNTCKRKDEPRADGEHKPFRATSDIIGNVQSGISDFEWNDLKLFLINFDNKPEFTVRHNAGSCGRTQNSVAWQQGAIFFSVGEITFFLC